MDRSDPRLEKVTSAGGRAARDYLLSVAEEQGWDIQVRGAKEGTPGTFVAHVQFRQTPGQRPYPFSLTLNPEVPTLYVRRPGTAVAELLAFDGAHKQGSEVKIPMPDLPTAKRIVARLFR